MQFRIPKKYTLSFLKALSMAILIGIPLGYFSSKQKPASFYNEDPLVVLLFAFGMGILIISRYFDYDDSIDNVKFIAEYKFDIIITIIVSLMLVFLIQFFGIILSLAILQYVFIILIMLTFGVRKFFHID